MASEDDDTFGLASDVVVKNSHAHPSMDDEGFGVYDGLDDDQHADSIALVAKTVQPNGSVSFHSSEHAHGAGRDRNTGYEDSSSWFPCTEMARMAVIGADTDQHDDDSVDSEFNGFADHFRRLLIF